MRNHPALLFYTTPNMLPKPRFVNGGSLNYVDFELFRGSVSLSVSGASSLKPVDLK